MRAEVDPRWIRTKSDEQAVKDGCWFDLAAAERVRDFFRRFLVHSTGKQWAGKPFELLEWQWQQVIAPVFAWKQANGLRRFSRAYLSTPKKNGKSALLSGLALYLLLGDQESGAEVYSAAADKEQAGIIYREAAKMVRASKALLSVLTVRDSTKTLIGPGGSFYRALAAGPESKDGINAHGILFDELHTQKGRELWDFLRYSGASREQSLHISITTAGGDLETICGEQYQYAKRVLSGEIIDISFLACIFEASPQDDWTSEETWKRANPSYGITVGADKFRADFNEALESPAKENAFRRFRLNQWVQSADKWLSMDRWDKGDRGPVDLAKLKGRRCFSGLDLSATDDTTALLLAFPDDEDKEFTFLPFFWLPEDNIDRLERKHKVPYRAWAKRGLFHLTPGNVVDYQVIRAMLRELDQLYDIVELAIDRKFQGQSLELDLVEDGFKVVPAGQGWVSQDLPAKELEKLVMAERIIHGGHPVLRWHASNAAVDIDKAGNYSVNKKKSRSKIDGIAATLMALMCKLQDRGAAKGKPYYETTGGEVTFLD
jgi:phage terminase large subunit-like protein